MDDNRNNLEDFFNKSIEQFNDAPSGDVWDGIENRLDADVGFFAKWMNWLKVIIPIAIVVSIFGFYQYNAQQKINDLKYELSSIQNGYEQIEERLTQIDKSTNKEKQNQLISENKEELITESITQVNNDFPEKIEKKEAKQNSHASFNPLKNLVDNKVENQSIITINPKQNKATENKEMELNEIVKFSPTIITTEVENPFKPTINQKENLAVKKEGKATVGLEEKSVENNWQEEAEASSKQIEESIIKEEENQKAKAEKTFKNKERENDIKVNSKPKKETNDKQKSQKESEGQKVEKNKKSFKKQKNKNDKVDEPKSTKNEVKDEDKPKENKAGIYERRNPDQKNKGGLNIDGSRAKNAFNKTKIFFKEKVPTAFKSLKNIGSIRYVAGHRAVSTVAKKEGKSAKKDSTATDESGKYKVGLTFRTITAFVEPSDEYAASYSFGIVQYYQFSKIIAITHAFHFNSQFYFVNGPSGFLTDKELEGYPFIDNWVDQPMSLKVHSHYFDMQIGVRFNVFRSKRGFKLFVNPSIVGQYYFPQEFRFLFAGYEVAQTSTDAKFYFGSANLLVGVERRIRKSKLHWQLAFWTEHSFTPIGIEQKYINVFGGSMSILFGK